MHLLPNFVPGEIDASKEEVQVLNSIERLGCSHLVKVIDKSTKVTFSNTHKLCISDPPTIMTYFTGK